jgi:hypothetical protein
VEKLFSLGEFTSIGGGSSNFSVWELLLFILIGCLGGLIGACFNAGSEHLTIWRMKHINHSKKRRLLEAVAISMLVTTVSFVMPLLWGRCTELPTDMQDWTNQEKELVANLVPFNCIPGKEYNEGSFIKPSFVSLNVFFHYAFRIEDCHSLLIQLMFSYPIQFYPSCFPILVRSRCCHSTIVSFSRDG